MKNYRIAVGGVALVVVLALVLPALVGAATRATTVTVTAGKPSEFGFKLSTKTVKHGAVTFKVRNGGAIPHDFKICARAKGGRGNACTGKVAKLRSPAPAATLPYNLQ